jgi:hypothetical protein
MEHHHLGGMMYGKIDERCRQGASDPKVQFPIRSRYFYRGHSENYQNISLASPLDLQQSINLMLRNFKEMNIQQSKGI